MLLRGGAALSGAALVSAALSAADSPDWLIYLGSLAVIGSVTFYLIYTAASDRTTRSDSARSTTSTVPDGAAKPEDPDPELEQLQRAMEETSQSMRAAVMRYRSLSARLGTTPSTEAGRGESSGGHASLTPTERQIALLLVEGKSHRQIAESLLLSLKTVRVHVARITSKLSATERGQAGALAHGDPDDPTLA